MVHDAGVRALERCRTGSPFSDSVRLSGGFGPGAGSDRGKRTGQGRPGGQYLPQGKGLLREQGTSAAGPLSAGVVAAHHHAR
ncbi:hypothetical protein SGLAM104S_03536 [Streptomyces glaucescens]